MIPSQFQMISADYVNCSRMLLFSKSKMSNIVHVLQSGYSKADSNESVRANCSCVLVTGSSNVVIDTMTPWDRDLILESLYLKGYSPDNINYVVCTHGHSDHIGNNNLFLRAKQIVGYCVSFEDHYFLHPFDQGKPYIISEGIQVIPTPGHTADDVSVVIETKDQGTVVIAGDIFEREEDIENPEIWRSQGGSTDPERQERSRAKILSIADYIVPGHGPMFKVTQAMKDSIRH